MEVFMELPQYYGPNGIQGRDVVLHLEKSIYGQMDSPKLFYEHLSTGMMALGFEPTPSDPCLFVHKTLPIMVLNYCDDQIWLSSDDKHIENYVKQLAELGYDRTLEPKGDMFGFLGINFKRNGPAIELTQVGPIQKMVKYTGMEKANSLPISALKEPLDMDPMASHSKRNGTILQQLACCCTSCSIPDLIFSLLFIRLYALPIRLVRVMDKL